MTQASHETSLGSEWTLVQPMVVVRYTLIWCWDNLTMVIVACCDRWHKQWLIVVIHPNNAGFNPEACYTLKNKSNTSNKIEGINLQIRMKLVAWYSSFQPNCMLCVGSRPDLLGFLICCWQHPLYCSGWPEPAVAIENICSNCNHLLLLSNYYKPLFIHVLAKAAAFQRSKA